MTRALMELAQRLGRSICPPDSGNPVSLRASLPAWRYEEEDAVAYYPIMSQI